MSAFTNAINTRILLINDTINSYAYNILSTHTATSNTLHFVVDLPFEKKLEIFDYKQDLDVHYYPANVKHVSNKDVEQFLNNEIQQFITVSLTRGIKEKLQKYINQYIIIKPIITITDTVCQNSITFIFNLTYVLINKSLTANIGYDLNFFKLIRDNVKRDFMPNNVFLNIIKYETNLSHSGTITLDVNNKQITTKIKREIFEIPIVRFSSGKFSNENDLILTLVQVFVNSFKPNPNKLYLISISEKYSELMIVRNDVSKLVLHAYCSFTEIT